MDIHQAEAGLKAWSPRRYGTPDVTKVGAILDDALAHDMFTQAAQAVRMPAGIDPISIHSPAGVFDAFFLVGGVGLLRTDLDAKVFKLLSETDVGANQAAPASRTQTTSPLGRSWPNGQRRSQNQQPQARPFPVDSQ